MADSVLLQRSFTEFREYEPGETITYELPISIDDVDDVITGSKLIQASWHFPASQPVADFDVEIRRADGTIAASNHDAASLIATTTQLVGQTGGTSSVSGGASGPTSRVKARDVIGGGPNKIDDVIDVTDQPDQPPPFEENPHSIKYELGPNDQGGIWLVSLTNRSGNTAVRINGSHPFKQRPLRVTRIPRSLLDQLIANIHRLAGAKLSINGRHLLTHLNPEFVSLLQIDAPQPLDVVGDLGTVKEAIFDRIVGETESINFSLSAAGDRLRMQVVVDFGADAEIRLSGLSDEPFREITVQADLDFDKRRVERTNEDFDNSEVDRTRPQPSWRISAEADPEASVTFAGSEQFNLEETANEKIGDVMDEHPATFAEIADEVASSIGFLATGSSDHIVYDVGDGGDDLVVRTYASATVQLRLPGGPVGGTASEQIDEGPTAPGPIISAAVDLTSSDSTARQVGRAAEHVLDREVVVHGELVRAGKIDHVVVLMLENRSFDNMLGWLSLPESQGGRGRTDIDGLDRRNRHTNPDPRSNRDIAANPYGDGVVVTDPPHGFDDTLFQIDGGSMSKFVERYRERVARVRNGDVEDVMGYNTHELVQMYDFLAREYGVCDRWFCSNPGATYPNRFISLSGRTPDINNLHIGGRRAGAVKDRTIFDVLTANRVSWNYVEGNIAFLRMFNRYRIDDTNIIQHAEFFDLARSGRLPAVTWIDPNFKELAPHEEANDDHPPVDVRLGQQLVADIYRALTANAAQWERTLFVVTYDEHGGFYDHVPPHGMNGETEPPVPRVHPRGVEHLGPRVPAMLVSPWIPRGHVSSRVFDHTSILRTILENFLGEEAIGRGLLGERVDTANSLLDELSDTVRPDRPSAPTIDAPTRLSRSDLPPADFDATSFHLGMQLFAFAPSTRRDRVAAAHGAELVPGL